MYSSSQITGKKAKKLADGGAKLIDTRTPVQFRDGTLPGAVNISPRQASTLITYYPKSTKLVFFGDDQATIDACMNYATAMGFINVYTFGSIENWNT